MLLTPICFFVALYASFVYGIFFAILAPSPIDFEEERDWNLLVGALPFLALLVGILLGGAANLLNQSHYNRRFIAAGNVAVPEACLLSMMFGSSSLPVVSSASLGHLVAIYPGKRLVLVP